MPKYAPQSLPMGAERKAPDQQGAGTQKKPGPGQSAIQLGQYIRRERGMQGVRGYVAAVREYLPEQEYVALCKAMGVTAQKGGPVKRPEQHPTHEPVVQHNPAPQNNSPANQMQMMQMLSQFMNMQQGNNAAVSGGNGINPMLLAQLLNGMGGNM